MTSAEELAAAILGEPDMGAVAATYHPQEGEPFPLTVTFGEAWVGVSPMGELINSRQVYAAGRHADLAGAREQDRVEVGGQMFEVAAVQPDAAFVRLRLHGPLPDAP